MPSPSRLKSPPHLSLSFLVQPLWRHRGLAGVALACAMLAGCATQPGQTASNDVTPTWQDGRLVGNSDNDTSFNGSSATGDSNDPIRDILLGRQVRRTRPAPSVARTSEDNFVEIALALQGVRYRFGGNSPRQGFDCSGLVAYVAMHSWGMKLPRESSEMAQLGQRVAMNNLEPGDLVFFRIDRRNRISHVGIYIGNGEFVHAPSSGGTVRTEAINTEYWMHHYAGARRLDPSNQVAANDVR